MTWDPGAWPLTLTVAVFLVAAAVTVYGGVRLSVLGDTLADKTGLGEALFGAVLLGAATSLSGIVMTAAAALNDRPGLAYSNAIGGVAAQTAALVVADMFYTKANLEHASASLSNTLNGVIVVMLLALTAGFALGPELSFWNIHAGSPILVGIYLFGLYMARSAGADPMWHAEQTTATKAEESDPDASVKSMPRLLTEFGLIACVVSAGGWAVAQCTSAIIEQTGMTETQGGVLLMGIVNALPETVVAVSAVRQGAVTLAVAGVLGGNAFDVLNVAIGDVAYRGGSLYHAADDQQLLLVMASVFMTATLVAGQLHRQRRGPGNIGLESALVLAAYIGVVVLISV